ncbi:MAG: TRAP transporter small permease [Alphaproteobacteria bacterium]|nr:TRAP transporter small permease [Alphaproteobacteria bacterium]
MNILERLFTRVSWVMLYASAISLLLMSALVVIASAMRYLVGSPFDFTEELVALLYMSMVFLAIPLVTMQGTHVNVSVLPQRLQRGLEGPLRIGAGLVMIAFCTWFTIEAYAFVEQSYKFNSKTEQVEILLWPWMSVIPIAMGFVTVIAVFHLFKKAPEPKPDDGEARPLGDAL